MDADGYCFQHFASRTEAARKAELARVDQERRDAAITAYLAWTAEHPSVHDRPPGSKPWATQAESTRGLAGIKVVELGGVEPPSRVPPAPSERRRRPPHQISPEDL